MSDRLKVDSALETEPLEFWFQKAPKFEAAFVRIQEQRRKFVRLGSALLLCSLMLLCWRFGTPGFGAACLIFWALVDWRARKWSNYWSPSIESVARQVERIDPSLEGRLSTAVEQDGAGSDFTFVQLRLFEEVVQRSEKSDWERCVPARTLSLLAFGLGIARCGALFACLLLFFSVRARSPDGSSMPDSVQGKAIEPSVLPGNVEIEKGSRLSVNARFEQQMMEVQFGFRSLSPSVALNGRLPMLQAVGEPLYGVSLESIESDLEYWVETTLGASEHYTVKVFEYPKLDQSDALVLFPSGTDPSERHFENARNLTVPEGSSIDWNFQFNKPIKSVRLVYKGGRSEVLPLLEDGAGSVWKLNALAQSVEAKLELEDFQARSAKAQVEFRVRVLPNASPKIRPILPRGDARFTMVEEVDFEAEALDESTLLRWGMGLQIGAGAVEEFVLGTSAKSGQKVRMNHAEALEQRKVRVGDSLSWFFWAEDLDGAGKIRRTEGDLLLGRIRGFDEIYRQDDSEEEGKASGGPQLLELQKQVMSATWNVRRKLNEAGINGSGSGKELQIVKDSESKVVELAREKLDLETNEVRRGYYREAVTKLEKAVAELGASASQTGRIELALEAERGAYDALTHISPSSYLMKQSSKPNAGKVQEQARQMSDLDFAKQEDRYQSKKEAVGDKEEEDRSQMEELLAKLRALARRQEEVNERMKDLEARIRNGGDEKEREAAKRDLKRLSDEQKAVTQELESLQQNASQKNETLAEQSQELDAARKASQRAASALDKDSLEDARASAARALDKLRLGSDSLRQKLSGRTREAARELQERAQELVVEEQKIADALNTQKKGPSKLSDMGMGKEIESQRRRFKELQDELQRASEATESSEVLFSKALQDAHRTTIQNQTELKFKVVEEALSSRRQEIARKAEKAVSKDIQELSAAVEKAADEVFGDEAQALRRARAEVDEIARDLLHGAGLAADDRLKQSQETTKVERGDAPGKAGSPNEPSEGEHKAADPTGSQARLESGSSSVSGVSSSVKSDQDVSQKLRDPSKRAAEGDGMAAGSQKAESQSAIAAVSGKSPKGQGGADQKRDSPQSVDSPASKRKASASAGFSKASGGDVRSGGGVSVQDLGDLLNRMDRVESLLERPNLRSGVAKVQQVAEQLRGEIKRSGSKPSPQQIQQTLLAPLTELREAISSELAHREGKESDSPIDRDPVPRKHEPSVRRYYEVLGGAK